MLFFARFTRFLPVCVNQCVNRDYTMKATVDVVCYKSKPLKDGTFPLMLRVTKDRKRKYVSLGLSLHGRFWDLTKTNPNVTAPTRSKSNG